MPKSKQKKSEPKEPRLQNKTKEEIFWDMKGLKQCLWSYFIEIKKGRLMTQKDYDFVWDEFNKTEVDVQTRYAPVLSEKDKEKTDKISLVEVLSEEIDKMLAAKSLKDLKKIWLGFELGNYSEDEYKYLEKIKQKRKNELL